MHAASAAYIKFHLVQSSIVGKRYFMFCDPSCSHSAGNGPGIRWEPLRSCRHWQDRVWAVYVLQGTALGYGGNPYGPAGTGKTESVKALGQALARQVRCTRGTWIFRRPAFGKVPVGGQQVTHYCPLPSSQRVICLQRDRSCTVQWLFTRLPSARSLMALSLMLEDVHDTEPYVIASGHLVRCSVASS